MTHSFYLFGTSHQACPGSGFFQNIQTGTIHLYRQGGNRILGEQDWIVPNLASLHLSTKEAHVTGAEEADERVVAGAEPSVEAVGERKGEFDEERRWVEVRCRKTNAFSSDCW